MLRLDDLGPSGQNIDPGNMEHTSRVENTNFKIMTENNNEQQNPLPSIAENREDSIVANQNVTLQTPIVNERSNEADNIEVPVADSSAVEFANQTLTVSKNDTHPNMGAIGEQQEEYKQEILNPIDEFIVGSHAIVIEQQEMHELEHS